MTTHAALRTFVDRMDHTVAELQDPALIARSCAELLPNLLAEPDFLEERYRAARTATYARHIVHVHPQGLYSIVSLVWLPGQSTPVHDHRCWCVVGVLLGAEEETRFHTYERGPDTWLVQRDTTVYEPGDVCELVPPDEDIHRVRNAGDTTTISVHVYGADIAAVQTSINHVFEHDILHEAPAGAVRRSWRAANGGQDGILT